MGITGRPKSQNPRSVMASVRITERERDALIDMHGTVNAGLRAALDRLLLTAAGRVRIEPTASAEGQGKSKVMDDVIAVHGAGGGNPIEVGVEADLPERTVIIDEVQQVDPADLDRLTVGISVGQEKVIIDTLDYPGGRGKKVLSKPHVHKPASLVSSRHDQGVLMETWACECGTHLPERKAK